MILFDLLRKIHHHAVNVNLNTGYGSGGRTEGDQYYSIENVDGSHYDDTITRNDLTTAKRKLWK